MRDTFSRADRKTTKNESLTYCEKSLYQRLYFLKPYIHHNEEVEESDAGKKKEKKKINKKKRKGVNLQNLINQTMTEDKILRPMKHLEMLY